MNAQNFSVGEVKLSYRRKKSLLKKVFSADEAFRVLRKTFSNGQIYLKEYFKVLMLDTANNVVGWSTVGEGGITDCPADVRTIFQTALLSNATKIVLCHNHPSGSLKPSRQDDILTNEAVKAGRILRIPVVDHIILSDSDYFSYADEGKL